MPSQMLFERQECWNGVSEGKIRNIFRESTSQDPPLFMLMGGKLFWSKTFLSRIP